MNISVNNISKKFGNEWIVNNFTYKFESGKKYAIIGGNGSGKSTLLKLISGSLLQNEGEIIYSDANNNVYPVDLVANKIAWVAPYVELIEEMTLLELVKFYESFKPLAIDSDTFIEKLRLIPAKHKQICNFSSGMKQRLQLGLAIYSDASILLLDEPTSNLDEINIQWYLSLFKTDMKEKLVLISSNQKYEYSFCDIQITTEDFKKKLKS